MLKAIYKILPSPCGIRKTFLFPFPKTLFSFREETDPYDRNGRRVEERKREKIGEKRGVPYARTIEKKLAAILAPPHGQLPTRLPLSASPPLHSSLALCVVRHTASRATTAPNKIQSRRGREIITRLIGDGRNGRGSSSIRIQSQSPPGRGNFAFRSLGCLGWGISRNDRLPFRLPLIIIARFTWLIHRSLDSIVSSKGNVL